MALFKAYSTEDNIEIHGNLNFEQKVDDVISNAHENEKNNETSTSNEEILASDNGLFFIDAIGDKNGSSDNIYIDKLKVLKSDSLEPVKSSKSKKKVKKYIKRKNLDSKSFDLHIELKKLHNQLLHDENNIDLWKQFITSQEKNISVGNLKAVTERQISIIEEALKKNPRNDALYDMWFKCNRKIYPHNELTKIIIDRTEKDAGNFQLWLALIDCTQQSISECNSTDVLNLYRKAITSFKKIRQQNISNRGVLFKLFQRISIFLRQTGSWKELLYFLEYTIWLNCDCDLQIIFKFPEISNSLLIELEETVLQSGLPLSEIWFRIESLRETFIWSTVKTDFNNMACNLAIEEMDDLTTVFSEDTTKFHLFLHVLSVLRIPILPRVHMIYEKLGLNNITWHVDSCEHFLHTFYEDCTKNSEILQILYDMLSTIIDGPQYWGPRPFTTNYSDFVLSLIKNLMDYTKDEDTKIAFGLIYIRFVILQVNLMKYAEKINNIKSIKKKVKTLLSENNYLKSSMLLYIEYAKLETISGDVNSGLKTLQVLLDSTSSNSSDYCYLIKTYIDFSLLKDKNIDKKQFLNLLSKVAYNKPFNETDITTILSNFYNVNNKIEPESITPILIIPNMQENYICCGAYFILFTLGIEKSIEYIYKVCENAHSLTESMQEWVASISYYNPDEKIIQEFLSQAISQNPHNSKLLFAYINCSIHWSVKRTVLTKSVLGIILMVCFAKLKEIKGLDESEKLAYKNRQSSILNDVMKDESITRYPIIWKIYLQFLYENGSNKIMDIMTQAIEKFPWLKAFYVSGVRYVPQEHSAFQDIIAEKELTLLALTEELEILRQDSPD